MQEETLLEQEIVPPLPEPDAETGPQPKREPNRERTPRPSPPTFRQGVAAIVIDSQRRILICERNNPTDSWQFVQGGISPGEGEEQALIRELGEEIGVFPHDVQILACILPRFRYTLKRTSKQYKNKGQEHRYFVVQIADFARLNLAAEHKPEFRSARFVKAAEFPFEKVFEKKRCIYWDVLNMLEPLIGPLAVPRPELRRFVPRPDESSADNPVSSEPTASEPPLSEPLADTADSDASPLDAPDTEATTPLELPQTEDIPTLEIVTEPEQGENI